MTQVHVVRHDNSQLDAAQLDQYFRRRYDVFVRERGWTDIERPDGRDIDQFDTEDAIHLLAIDKDEVVGGLRFNPSSGPTLLNDVYPHLCFGPLSRSPDIHETTRLWVVKERRSEVLQPSVEVLLVAASLELSIALGVRKTRVLFETRRLGRNRDLAGRWSRWALPTRLTAPISSPSKGRLRGDLGRHLPAAFRPRPGPGLERHGAARLPASRIGSGNGVRRQSNKTSAARRRGEIRP